MKDLNRRDFLRLSASSSVAAGMSLAGCESGLIGQDKPKKQPNIIFLLTDDQRADTMGCTGNPIIQTPNMDAMAKGGVHGCDGKGRRAVHERLCHYLDMCLQPGERLLRPVDKPARRNRLQDTFFA